MTDPIAAARALIKPLTGHTPKPWWTSGKYSGSEMGCSIIATNPNAGPAPGNPTRGQVAFATAILNTDARRCEANARLIVAAPDLRDMVPTLADALEAERAKVAAAYEAAAQAVRAVLTNSPTGEWGAEGISMSRAIERAIHALAASDARAALDKMLAEARLEGWRAGRGAAAEIVDGTARYHMSDPDDIEVVRLTAAEIRALPEPKESSHD